MTLHREARLEGALAAARIASERMGEAKRAAREEQDRVAAEVAFLRSQLEQSGANLW